MNKHYRVTFGILYGCKDLPGRLHPLFFCIWVCLRTWFVKFSGRNCQNRHLHPWVSWFSPLAGSWICQFSRTQLPRQSVASAHFLNFTSGRDMDLPNLVDATVAKEVCIRSFLFFKLFVECSNANSRGRNCQNSLLRPQVSWFSPLAGRWIYLSLRMQLSSKQFASAHFLILALAEHEHSVYQANTLHPAYFNECCSQTPGDSGGQRSLVWCSP